MFGVLWFSFSFCLKFIKDLDFAQEYNTISKSQRQISIKKLQINSELVRNPEDSGIHWLKKYYLWTIIGFWNEVILK